MSEIIARIERPRNEGVLTYAPGTAEREAAKRAVETMSKEPRPLPMWIDGQAVETKTVGNVVCPHDHRRSPPNPPGRVLASTTVRVFFSGRRSS